MYKSETGPVEKVTPGMEKQRKSFMKSNFKIVQKVLFALTLAASLFTAAAVEPTDPPPRGHAYGYWMKDGGRVMFFYLDEDGSRLIKLLYCKPNARYRVEATTDIKGWRTLADLRIGPDGTASCTDFTPQPYGFYRVISLNTKF